MNIINNNEIVKIDKIITLDIDKYPNFHKTISIRKDDKNNYYLPNGFNDNYILLYCNDENITEQKYPDDVILKKYKMFSKIRSKIFENKDLKIGFSRLVGSHVDRRKRNLYLYFEEDQKFFNVKNYEYELNSLSYEKSGCTAFVYRELYNLINKENKIDSEIVSCYLNNKFIGIYDLSDLLTNVGHDMMGLRSYDYNIGNGVNVMSTCNNYFEIKSYFSLYDFTYNGINLYNKSTSTYREIIDNNIVDKTLPLFIKYFKPVLLENNIENIDFNSLVSYILITELSNNTLSYIDYRNYLFTINDKENKIYVYPYQFVMNDDYIYDLNESIYKKSKNFNFQFFSFLLKNEKFIEKINNYSKELFKNKSYLNLIKEKCIKRTIMIKRDQYCNKQTIINHNNLNDEINNLLDYCNNKILILEKIFS